METYILLNTDTDEISQYETLDEALTAIESDVLDGIRADHLKLYKAKAITWCLEVTAIEEEKEDAHTASTPSLAEGHSLRQG